MKITFNTFKFPTVMLGLQMIQIITTQITIRLWNIGNADTR